MGSEANANTNAKEEQYRRVFRHLDMDGDGKITASELRRCVGMTEQEAEEAVRAEGGKIGMEEFLRMMEEGEEEEGEEEKEEGLKEAYKMYTEEEGRKSGGWITPRSLKRMLSRLGEKRSVEECEVMISTFDVDGDGLLSFHEFKLMMS